MRAPLKTPAWEATLLAPMQGRFSAIFLTLYQHLEQEGALKILYF